MSYSWVCAVWAHASDWHRWALPRREKRSASANLEFFVDFFHPTLDWSCDCIESAWCGKFSQWLCVWLCASTLTSTFCGLSFWMLCLSVTRLVTFSAQHCGSNDFKALLSQLCTMAAEHKQLPTEDVEEMLLEVPESPSTSKPRHWYFLGAGLALLVVLGVAAKVVYRSPETLLQSKNFDISTVQEWEEIPGIDKVVEHAKTLELKQPLRNLGDLFYESQPEELPWIRTECVIDVVQGAAYLGQAVVFLYKAIEYDGIRCPDNSPAGCAASVAGFITSVTWIASYLSFAANACGAAVNSGALCAGDWTALMANFGEMATVGAAVKEDCNFDEDWLAILKITGTDDAGPGWKTFVPAGASPTVETVTKVDALRTAHRNRAFDLTQCVVADVTNAASYIVRAILQIRSAASACPEPKACAINIMNIISSWQLFKHRSFKTLLLILLILFQTHFLTFHPIGQAFTKLLLEYLEKFWDVIAIWMSHIFFRVEPTRQLCLDLPVHITRSLRLLGQGKSKGSVRCWHFRHGGGCDKRSCSRHCQHLWLCWFARSTWGGEAFAHGLGLQHCQGCHECQDRIDHAEVCFCL